MIYNFPTPLGLLLNIEQSDNCLKSLATLQSFIHNCVGETPRFCPKALQINLSNGKGIACRLGSLLPSTCVRRIMTIYSLRASLTEVSSGLFVAA